MAGFIHFGTLNTLLTISPSITAKNTGSKPSFFTAGIEAISWAPSVRTNIARSDGNIPLRGLFNAAEVIYVRTSTKRNMYSAEIQSWAVFRVLGISGMAAGKAMARASIIAPAKTMIQSSDANCLIHFFIFAAVCQRPQR